jgi:hypothetical protein
MIPRGESRGIALAQTDRQTDRQTDFLLISKKARKNFNKGMVSVVWPHAFIVVRADGEV